MEPVIERASQVQNTNPQQPGIMTKDDWVRDYWFNSLQMITVINPLPDAWEFMVEMRHFTIGGGAKERFPGVIANVYLDQMSKILAQNEDKLGFMADPNLRKLYYDRLIVSKESLVNEADPTPAYMRQADPAPVTQPESAPWEAPEIAVEAPVAPPVAPPVPEQPKASVKAETKEFELEGDKFKLIVDKNGKSMFYKNGRMTSEAKYSKAASML